MMSGHPLVNHAEADQVMHSTSGYCAQTFDQAEQRRQLDFAGFLIRLASDGASAAPVRYSG